MPLNKDAAHTENVCAAVRLQPRLLCLAEAAGRCRCLGDVGTDHGYLPVWLLREGRIERAIASDINAEPLEHARRTARAGGVEDRMDFRLCAGLAGYRPGEADTVVIAGMGGENILGILEAAPAFRAERFLLQPMTRAELLRPALGRLGLRIVSERLVRDKGIIYTVMEVRSGESEPLTRAEIWCGRGLRADPLYRDYVSDRIGKLETAAAGMRKGKRIDEAALRVLESDAEALRREIEE